MYRPIAKITPLLILLISFQLGAAERRLDNFAVYYADQAPLSLLTQFDLLVLDSDIHPDIHVLDKHDNLLLGYLSLGEVEKHRKHFQDLKNEGLLLQENEDWPNSYFIDVRNPKWQRRVVEELVPLILQQGFNGIFLDTLDNPPHLERTEPLNYAGMTQAAVQLVQSIRHRFPNVPLMINRAYELLPEVANDVDMILGESVFSDYDFETKEYGYVDKDTYQLQVAILKQAQAKNPMLRIMTLDYWDPQDPKGITKIYREQRKNGFLPYVATIGLDQIILEPVK